MVLTQDEQTLLEGCRRGDNAAWLALFRAYASDVGGFLKGMLRNTNDIDDLTQRVFLKFISTLDRYRGDASLRTWLLRIARNVALQEIRSCSRREHYVRAYAESVSDAGGVSPEMQVQARRHLDLIERLLWTLDESFREVWVLREVGGCSVSEAAEVLEIPEATVRTRHYRARKKLFDLLAEIDGAEAAMLTRASKPQWTLIQGGGQ